MNQQTIIQRHYNFSRRLYEVRVAIRVNKRRKGLNNRIPPTSGLCADFLLGLWISTNSVATKKQTTIYSRRKRSPTLDPGSCLGYVSIFIDLLSCLPG